MAGLPDVFEGPEQSKKGRLEIFKDDCQEKVEDPIWTEVQNEEVVGEDSQSSTGSRGTVTSETSTTTSTTSITSSTPSVTQTLNKHVTAELAALSAKWTYQPETKRVASKRKEIQNAKVTSQPASAIPMPTKPLLQRQRSLTPLQRLGVGALNRSKSCGGLLGSAVNSPRMVDDLISSQESNTPTQKLHSLPIAYSMGPDASITKGSEDAIIPDSEESADDAASISEADEHAKPQINLGRFAFKG